MQETILIEVEHHSAFVQALQQHHDVKVLEAVKIVHSETDQLHLYQYSIEFPTYSDMFDLGRTYQFFIDHKPQ